MYKISSYSRLLQLKPGSPISYKLLFSALLFLIINTTSHSQVENNVKLDEFFERLEDKNMAMGNVVISRNGNIIYTNSFGSRSINEQSNQPITLETRHRVGSITKMFTSVMILQLVEEGKIKLTDNLEVYFPEIPNSDKITIRDVLAHRSGIHDITSNRDLRPERTAPITKPGMLEIITKGDPDFEPGTNFSYSNSGYFILGYLIEKVTGKSYQEALNDRITSKLGLKNTYTGTGEIDNTKNESFSYVRFEDWKKHPETHMSILFGSGALISTSMDLTFFMEALFSGKLISQESLIEMIPKENPYGLGMGSFKFSGKTFYGHTGGVDNFGSWLAYNPEEKLTIAYTANAKVYPVVKIMEGITDIYYDLAFEIPTFEAFIVNPEILEKYVGVYSRSGAPVKFTVTRDSSQLFIQMTGQPVLPLEATSNTQFKLESEGIMVEFNTEQNQMTFKRGSGATIFIKEN